MGHTYFGVAAPPFLPPMHCSDVYHQLFLYHITTSHIRDMNIRISRYTYAKLENTPQAYVHVVSIDLQYVAVN